MSMRRNPSSRFLERDRPLARKPRQSGLVRSLIFADQAMDDRQKFDHRRARTICGDLVGGMISGQFRQRNGVRRDWPSRIASRRGRVKPERNGVDSDDGGYGQQCDGDDHRDRPIADAQKSLASLASRIGKVRAASNCECGWSVLSWSFRQSICGRLYRLE
jgi:hypothetical protein